MKNGDFEGNAVKTVEREKSRQLGLRSELFPISPGIDSYFSFFFFSSGFPHFGSRRTDQSGEASRGEDAILLKISRHPVGQKTKQLKSKFFHHLARKGKMGLGRLAIFLKNTLAIYICSNKAFSSYI